MSFNDIEIGDLIETNCDGSKVLPDGQHIVGVVMEIDDSFNEGLHFYIAHNNPQFQGSMLNESPLDWDFNYSWKFKSCSNGYFKILEKNYCDDGYNYNKTPKITSDKQNNKNMIGVIKNIFKSTEKKALEHYGITNGNGGLTATGQQEFIDFLWQKNAEMQKEFTEMIVAEYKKDLKIDEKTK